MANSRAFHDFLREHRQGVTHDELSDALQELVAAVSDAEKPGTLTFTITIKPTKSGALEVSDSIKTKLPKLPKSSSLFFVSPENNLIREDPKQHRLNLQEINVHMEARPIAPASAAKALA